jgi:hypothetical protein
MQYCKVVLAICFLSVASLGYGDSVEDKLVASALSINSKMPVMVDADTRADKVVAGPGRRFSNYYTVLRIATVADVDSKKFMKERFDHGVAIVCSGPKIATLFKLGVTSSYVFSAKNGEKIGSFDLTPSDCGFR